MAKKWVNAGFKSRGEAMEYCAHVGPVRYSIVVSCDPKGFFRNPDMGLIAANGYFWNMYASMKIEIDKPELEVGKLYQVSADPFFKKDVTIAKLVNYQYEDDIFSDENGYQWTYYREIPAELIGKIK